MNGGTEQDVALVEPAPVFHGSMVEATVVRSALAANGFSTFIEGEAIKTLHPFVTGANALDVRLFASASDVPRIAEVLPELRSVEEEEDAPSAAANDELEALGVRTRWACVASGIMVVAPVKMASAACLGLVFLLPLALMLGVRYLERARRLDTRPRFHWITVPVILAMFFLVTPVTLLFIYWFLAGLGPFGSGIFGP